MVPPLVLSPGASSDEVARAAAVRKAHPLYSTITLQLLQEVINGRLFTTGGTMELFAMSYHVMMIIGLQLGDSGGGGSGVGVQGGGEGVGPWAWGCRRGSMEGLL